MEEDISLRKLADEVANLDIENILVHVTRRGKNLVLAPEVAGLFSPDSAGRLRPKLNTSGKAEVTEDSAADLYVNSNYANRHSLANLRPTFGGLGISGVSDAVAKGIQPQVLFFEATVTAGGDFVTAPMIVNSAGLKTCCRIDYIYTVGADPAWDMTLSCTSGIEGPAVLPNLDSSGGVIAPDWRPGLYFRASADSEDIELTIANGGNALVYYVAGIFWYEP